MTEDGSDATTTASTTTNTTSINAAITPPQVAKSNGARSGSRSRSCSRSGSRSPTPSSSSAVSNESCPHTSSSTHHNVTKDENEFTSNVNLLQDPKFLELIKQCAKKRNNNLDTTISACILDKQHCIVGFSSGSDGGIEGDDLLKDPQFLMDIAHLAAARSGDPKTKVGACIVDTKNRIIGIGYNRFPVNYSGVAYPWFKCKTDPMLDKRTYVVHAEADAIIGRSLADLRGATIYSTLLPCNECAKLIIQSGIRKVYYKNSKLFEKWIYKASRRLLDGARIELQKLQ